MNHRPFVYPPHQRAESAFYRVIRTDRNTTVAVTSTEQEAFDAAFAIATMEAVEVTVVNRGHELARFDAQGQRL